MDSKAAKLISMVSLMIMEIKFDLQVMQTFDFDTIPSMWNEEDFLATLKLLINWALKLLCLLS